MSQDHKQIPPIEGPHYIVQALFDAGVCGVAGMGGLVALSWADLEAFNRASGAGLNAWELSIVRLLSAAYVEASAPSKNAPPPYMPEGIDRNAVSEKVKAVLRSFRRGRR